MACTCFSYSKAASVASIQRLCLSRASAWPGKLGGETEKSASSSLLALTESRAVRNRVCALKNSWDAWAMPAVGLDQLFSSLSLVGLSLL